MKALLLNPPGPFCRAGSRWPHRRAKRSVGIDYHPFPFSLAYATARLLADGHDARLIDCVALSIDEDDLLQDIEQFQPDIVLIETSAPSFLADTALARRINTPCIAVGSHATAVPDTHVSAGFTAAVKGEYDPVATIAIRMGDDPWLAKPGKPAAAHVPLDWNLDAMPWPPWNQMPMEKYNDPFCKGRSVTVLSSRGCPNRCSFCTLEPYTGRRAFRRRSPVSVCDELDELIRRYHPDELYFDDDAINGSRAHILGLCEELRRRDFGIPFSCMGLASVDHDVLEAMAASGCRAYKFGVETGDPEVMQRIGKDLNLEQIRETVRRCRELGILTHATFLIGLPGENRQSTLRTIDFALSLEAHTLQFAIATPYPGTPFFEQAKAQGWLQSEHDWNAFDPAGSSAVSYPDYSAAEIAEMHDLAWRRWQWHMLCRRPATLLHHFSNAWRREGYSGVWRLAQYGASRLLSVWNARK